VARVTCPVRRACLVLCAWCLVMAAPAWAQKPEVEDCDAKRAEACRLLRHAAEIGKEIPEKSSYFMIELAMAQARAGDFEGALATVEQEGGDDTSAAQITLRGIASERAVAGDVLGALRILDGLPEDQKANALDEVAYALAEAGLIDEAVPIAMGIPSPARRAATLVWVAWFALDAGRKDGVPELLRQGLAANAIAEVETYNPDIVHKYGAVGMARAGNAQDALAIAGRLPDEHQQGLAYAEIAEVLTDAGDKEGALLALKNSLATAQLVRNRGNRAENLEEIAKGYVGLGDAQSALGVAHLMPIGVERIGILHAIAAKQADLGRLSESFQTVALIEDLREEVPYGTRPDPDPEPGWITLDGPEWISAYRALARFQASAGDFSGAVEATSRMMDPGERIRALREVAEEQLKSEDSSGAASTLRLAAQEGSKLEWYSVCEELSLLASDQVRAGDSEGSLQTIQTMLARSKGEGSSEDRSETCIAKASQVQSERGDIKAALDLARRLEPGDYLHSDAFSNIARAQVESGNVDGAIAIVEAETDALARIFGLIGVAKALTESKQCHRQE